MKNLKFIVIFAVAGLLMAAAGVPAQEKETDRKNKRHKVVFEVNVGGEEAWEGVLNNVENLQKAFGEEKSEIEVVLHGKGLGMIMKTNANQAQRLKELSGKGVIFAACENTMQRMKVTRDELFPFVVTVDSGLAETVRKQEAGWSYIKGGS